MSFIFNRIVRNLIVLAMLSSTAHPISEKAATAGAISSGVAAGLGMGALIYFGLFNSSSSSTKRISVSGIVGLGAGGIVGYYLHKKLYELTPTSKLAEASAIVLEVVNDPLTIKLATDYDFKVYASKQSGNGMALPLGKQELSNNLKRLALALNVIDLVKKEINQNPRYKLLAQQCSLLIEKIISLSSTIENNLNIVINHENYGVQAQLYDQCIEAEHIYRHQELLKNIISDNKNVQNNEVARQRQRRYQPQTPINEQPI